MLLLLLLATCAHGAIIVVQDSSFPAASNTVWMGQPFDVSFSGVVLLPGTTVPTYWISLDCNSVRPSMRVTPENCSFTGPEATYMCKFFIRSSRMLAYLISTATVFACDNNHLCVCSSYETFRPVGSLSIVFPFTNPRQRKGKYSMQFYANTAFKIIKASLEQPITENFSFTITIPGTRFALYNGEVALSADNCDTPSSNNAVFKMSDTTMVSVTATGLVLKSIALPAGLWTVCMRRAPYEWYSVTASIGDSSNDILVGSSDAYPTAVVVLPLPGKTPYFVFGDTLIASMTFPPQTQTQTVSIVVDYSHNLCATPPLVAAAYDRVLTANTQPVVVNWTFVVAYDSSIVTLGNWALAFCFKPAVPTKQKQWRAVGPTVYMYTCPEGTVNVDRLGCRPCPSHNGGTVCSGAHGTCNYYPDTVNDLFQNETCLCYPTYSGKACQITACLPPVLSLPTGTYNTPTSVNISPSQAECVPYYEVITSGVTSGSIKQSGSVSFAANGTYTIQAFAGGPASTNVNSSRVSIVVSLLLVASRPTITRPLPSTIDALCVDVDIAINHTPHTACVTYYSMSRTELALTAKDVQQYATPRCIDNANRAQSNDTDVSYTIRAWNVCAGYLNSSVAQVVFVLSRRLAAPTVSPPSGRFPATVTAVIVAAALPPIGVLVTVDGIVVAGLTAVIAGHGTHTVTAEAFLMGYRTSTTTVSYVVTTKAAPPTFFSSESGSVIKASCVEVGCVVWYRTTQTSPFVVFANGSVTVTSTVTVYGFTTVPTDTAYDPSNEVNITFTRLGLPTSSPVPGTYVGPLVVSFASATPNATVRLFTGKQNMTTPGRHTLVVAAVHPSLGISANATFVYDIQFPLPSVTFQFDNDTRTLRLSCANPLASIVVVGRAGTYNSPLVLTAETTVVSAFATILPDGSDRYNLPSAVTVFVVGGADMLPDVQVAPSDGVFEAPLYVVAQHTTPGAVLRGNASTTVLTTPGRYTLTFWATKPGWADSRVMAVSFVIVARVGPVVFLFDNATNALFMHSATPAAVILFSLDGRAPYLTFEYSVEITQQQCTTIRAFASAPDAIPSDETLFVVCNNESVSALRFELTSSSATALWALHTHVPLREALVPFTANSAVICTTPIQRSEHYLNWWVLESFQRDCDGSVTPLGRNASVCGHHIRWWDPEAPFKTAAFDHAARSMRYAAREGAAQYPVTRRILSDHAAVDGVPSPARDEDWGSFHDRLAAQCDDMVPRVGTATEIEATHALVSGVLARGATMAVLLAQHRSAATGALESLMGALRWALATQATYHSASGRRDGFMYVKCVSEVVGQMVSILSFPRVPIDVYAMGVDACLYNVASGPLREHRTDVTSPGYLCSVLPETFTLRAHLTSPVTPTVLADIDGVLQWGIAPCPSTNGTTQCLYLEATCHQQSATHEIPPGTEFVATVADASAHTLTLYSITSNARTATLYYWPGRTLNCTTGTFAPTTRVSLGAMPLTQMLPKYDRYLAKSDADSSEQWSLPFVEWAPPAGSNHILEGLGGNATVRIVTDIPTINASCVCTPQARCVVSAAQRDFTFFVTGVARHRCTISVGLAIAEYTLSVRLPPIPLSAVRPHVSCFTSELDSVGLSVLETVAPPFQVMLRQCGGASRSVYAPNTTRMSPSSCVGITITHPFGIDGNETIVSFPDFSPPAEFPWSMEDGVDPLPAHRKIVQFSARANLGVFIAAILMSCVTAIGLTLALLQSAWDLRAQHTIRCSEGRRSESVTVVVE